jgi:hypothetical protein
MEEISMAFGSAAFLVIVGGVLILGTLKALRGAAGAVGSDSRAKQGFGVLGLAVALILVLALLGLAEALK